MHSNNKSLITKHIRVVAKKEPVFRMIDLIHAYFCCHHSDAWQERLDSLVRRHELYTKSVLVKAHKNWYARYYSLSPF